MLCLLWLPALAEAIASVPFATESYSQHEEALQGQRSENTDERCANT